MDPADAIISSWSAPIVPITGLLLFLLLYVRGWFRLQLRAPNRFPFWRLLAFIGGLITIFLALASPLDAFANLLLQVHMVQHLLLMMIAPPLLLAGAPYLPLLLGSPRWFVRDVVSPFLTWDSFQRFAKLVSHPIFAWIAFVSSNLLWHLPFFYELALSSQSWHNLEHLSFLCTGLLFWWHLIQPWPSRPVWPRWTMIPYLLLADIQNTALAAFLCFYDQVLYPTYQLAPRLWGIKPLDDQVLAGTIMWVPGSLVFLVPATVIAVQLLSPSGKPGRNLLSRRSVLLRQGSGGHVGEVWLSRRAEHPRLSKLRPTKHADPATVGFDLFKIPVLGALIKAKAFRRGLQMVMLVLAAAIVFDGFLGPQTTAMNLAGVLPWTHWRGLTVIMLLIAGNFFCMICPFTFVRDLGRRLFPNKRAWPRYLRTKWFSAGLIVLYLWAYEAFSLWNSPWLTAWLVAGYFAAAFVIDGFFHPGSFCKYVCPIGQFHFVQSLVSPLEVKVRTPAICSTCRTFDCIRGRDDQTGCELKLFQPKKQSSFDCTFCMDCVHACPHDNVGLLTVQPGTNLWNGTLRSSIGRFANRTDVAVLVILLVFGALTNAAAMITPITDAFDWVMRSLAISRPVVIAVFLLVGMLILPGTLVAVSANVSRLLAKRSFIQTFSDFSMTLVPLGFGMWLAHLLFHLFTASHTPIPVFQRLIAGALHTGQPNWGVASWAFPQLLDLQILLLDAGLLLSWYAAWRVAKRLAPDRPFGVFAPWLLLGVLYFLTAIWIVFQPMDMRGMLMS
jgi:cytochrome c oxidase assembly factor CtaG/polyferredoxin